MRAARHAVSFPYKTISDPIPRMGPVHPTTSGAPDDQRRT